VSDEPGRTPPFQFAVLFQFPLVPGCDQVIFAMVSPIL
jgi:hypothetical protein